VTLGLDLERWDAGGYVVPFMARAVAFYRLRNYVSLNQQDAVARKAARKK